MPINGLLIAAPDGFGGVSAEQQADDPVQGDLAYFDGSAWQRLAPGTSGQYLQTQGPSADPQWGSVNEPGVVIYDPSSTDPMSPSPTQGDLYYNTSLNLWMFYDGSRTKWLSVETCEVLFGRRRNTGAGAYYKMIDGLSFSSTLGRRAAHNGTVVGMSYTRSNTTSTTFDVTANGSNISGAALSSSAASGATSSLDGDFSSGDVLGVRNRSGGGKTRDVMGYVRIRWRS